MDIIKNSGFKEEKMTLGQLLKQRRKELKLSMAKLGKLAGISPTHIMNIEKGSIPANQILILLAKALGLDHRDILKRGLKERDPEIWKILQESDKQFEAVNSDFMLSQMIPLIDATQAGEWIDVIDAYQPGQGMDEVAVSSTRRDLIALRVKGNSMEPVIRDGQIVVVDPHREAITGDIIIAVKDDKSTIKRFHQVNRETVILEPLNSAFENIVLKSGDLRIVGVVIEIKLII